MDMLTPRLTADARTQSYASIADSFVLQEPPVIE